MTALHRVTDPSQTVDDAAVLERSKHDPQYFAEIFDRHFVGIRGFIARRLGRDIADDVASDAFMTAFRKRTIFDPALGTVRAWLYGIAATQIGLHRRAEVRRYRALARLHAETRPGRAPAGTPVQDEGLNGALAEALARLSAKDRDVLLLVALAELSYEEVAHALSIPYGTVCSRLSRARRQVRGALETGKSQKKGNSDG